MKNAINMKSVVVSILTMLISFESIAWTEWTPHAPYDITGKTPEQVYRMAQDFKRLHREYDSSEYRESNTSYRRLAYVYNKVVNGIEIDRNPFLHDHGAKHDATIWKSLQNFNSALSLLECVVDCNCSLSAAACIELGDLYMSNPRKIKLNDPYNMALKWYSRAGDLGIERGYDECAQIWLIPDGCTEEKRKTNACRYYQLAIDLCLRQGRKTDAYIYVDKIRNLGYLTLSTRLLDELKSHKGNQTRKEK